MLGGMLLPTQLGGTLGKSTPAVFVWLNRRITAALQAVSRRACTHPIHTIVFVALLASTSYVGLLEGSIFDQLSALDKAPVRADWGSLIQGSRTLRLDGGVGWKWQTEENGVSIEDRQDDQHLALVTLVFVDSLTPDTKIVPQGPEIIDSQNVSTASSLPSTSNRLTAISQDSTLTYSIPYHDAEQFLQNIQEIEVAQTSSPPVSRDENASDQTSIEEKRWIMKAAKGDGHDKRGMLQRWAGGAWNGFVDLLKNAETLDIVIMILGYLSMHLTFVSLFLSMRRMGSNFWLATTVLFSSVFAFLFGLIITSKSGVPLNLVLLSEGLPFLVVTIGFEKPIILTKAVLSASLSRRQRASSPVSLKNGAHSNGDDTAPVTIQYAVQAAVEEKGFEIVRDYCIEIVILVAGAASGVQGGLRQFCFLAAWILVFDCILLFTFYTAILSIKLEINRIRRHVALRKALEEDGVSRRVAENVAQRNEWPKASQDASRLSTAPTTQETPIFGRKIREGNVPTFKVLMVSGFILINVFNLCTIPFRSGHRLTSAPAVSGLSSVVTQPPMDPFTVAGNGLDFIFNDAKDTNARTIVTVLAPIKYEFELPSVHYASMEPDIVEDYAGSFFDTEHADIFLDAVGGRVVESLLKSLEDPALSKWMIVALVMSVILNGYLFNAARWSIKEPRSSDLDHQTEATARRENGEVTRQAPGPVSSEGRRNEEGDGGANRADDGGGSGDDQPLTMKAARNSDTSKSPSRSQAECEQLLKEKRARELTDREIVELSLRGKVPTHGLERLLGDCTRAVKLRRMIVSRTSSTSATTSLFHQSMLPYEHYDFGQVLGACCESVVGYMPLPVGVAGPLIIDGQSLFLPMATTEGVLVASTNRGCKAINASGGATTVLTADGMTRGPCISFDTLERAASAKIWLDSEVGQKTMKRAFDSTSRFARLQSMKTALAGTNLYVRFKTTTGDAMGMNMITKGVEHALDVMANESGFEDMFIVSVSGNYCTDKKPAAVNWIEGRGKSVAAEAIISGDIVRKVLRCDVDALVDLNTSKNLIGSAMAGSVGGFNAHASNLVTAVFLATGQDPAQNVESSNCITIMKNVNGNLHVTVSMPSVEVGTVGGGTVLEPQGAILDMLGVRGPHPISPGDNARKLARIVAAAVLAGELSLCSALAEGTLAKSHMAHNRSANPTRTGTPVSAPPTPSSLPSRAQTPVTLAMTSIHDRSAKEASANSG
ncbi:MAG: 3-hydroxy-3-methylglutaryl-coenzyme A (HMG-CoA) reductase isozyme [Piccolia ochrophora]|nr:MAG: 3-hydroxy-3-methylglutaryl-coenzyme A (HMG-CoA) reductase isozyme [Piccolia ochrophora]